MPESRIEDEYLEQYGDNEEDYRDPDELSCLICGGDGYIDGCEMAEMDPLWYDEDQYYRCYSCNGTGKRKDMTVW